ncbi:hypothetical protein ABTX15_14640 [Micromonospora sp. NPDC094482]
MSEIRPTTGSSHRLRRQIVQAAPARAAAGSGRADTPAFASHPTEERPGA